MNIKATSNLSVLRQVYRAGIGSAAEESQPSTTSQMYGESATSSSASSGGVAVNSAAVSLGVGVLESLQGEEGATAANSSATSSYAPASTTGTASASATGVGHKTALIWGPADMLTAADKQMFLAVTGLTVGDDNYVHDSQGQKVAMTQNEEDLLQGMTMTRYFMKVEGNGDASFSAEQITNMMTRVSRPEGPVVVDRALMQRALDYVASTPS